MKCSFKYLLHDSLLLHRSYKNKLTFCQRCIHPLIETEKVREPDVESKYHCVHRTVFHRASNAVRKFNLPAYHRVLTLFPDFSFNATQSMTRVRFKNSHYRNLITPTACCSRFVFTVHTATVCHTCPFKAMMLQRSHISSAMTHFKRQVT
jgi:hypothetical protein